VESHLRRLVRRRKPQGGSLLDVGCGYGGFLERMQDTGWRLAGLELNESAAAYAAQRVPAASLVRAPIEEAPIAPGSQDCVVASAVLEHVKDPRATLRRLSSWLAPGGLLVVLVPYVVPYLKLKRLMPFLPIHFEAPRHLFDFSPVTLTRYFEELGFRDIRRAIGRPYASPSLLVTTLIWAAKAPGLALHALTGGRYVYPFAGSLLVHGLAPPPDDSA
jgi:SAM-dependent methyltransferase